MKFIEKVQNQFVEAGWKEGRNVYAKYKNGLRIEEFPLFMQNFLKEYGDLTVLDCKAQKSGGGQNQNSRSLDVVRPGGQQRNFVCRRIKID